MMRVSVIINTCNRGHCLAETLDELKKQTFTNFEVLLVNGPSIDETKKIAGRYNLRYFDAPFNISASRNIGIQNSVADIVAFIDDDAVPSQTWLEELLVPYTDLQVAAVGGIVYNGDGSGLQFAFGAIDFWGYPRSRFNKPFQFNDPKGKYFNFNLGTNCSFRRAALCEIGGFDEQFEYYHDETDVCVRLIKQGYRVVELNGASVFHKMAPSSRRNSSCKVVNYDSIVKNTIYFGIKNSAGRAPILIRFFKFIFRESGKFRILFSLLWRGHCSFSQYCIRNISLVVAFGRGYIAGFFLKRRLIKKVSGNANVFKPYLATTGASQTASVSITLKAL